MKATTVKAVDSLAYVFIALAFAILAAGIVQHGASANECREPAAARPEANARR
jgi:hypothetical protein